MWSLVAAFSTVVATVSLAESLCETHDSSRGESCLLQQRLVSSTNEKQQVRRSEQSSIAKTSSSHSASSSSAASSSLTYSLGLAGMSVETPAVAFVKPSAEDSSEAQSWQQPVTSALIGDAEPTSQILNTQAIDGLTGDSGTDEDEAQAAIEEARSAGADADSGDPHADPVSGEGSAGHGDAAANKVTGVASVMLLGMVVVIMALFMLVNFPDKDIQAATWSIVSSSLCIFIAVLLVDSFVLATATMWNDTPHMEQYSSSLLQRSLFGRNESGPTVEHTLLNLVYDFIRFFMCIGFCYALTRSLSSHPEIQHAVAHMTGHIVGFAAIGAFGDMQQCSPWKESPLMCFAALVLAVFSLSSLMWISQCLRKHGDHWTELIEEAENDAFGLSVAFLVCQVVKFCISGQLAAVHGSPHQKTLTMVTLLFLASFVFVGIMAPVSRKLKQISRDREITHHPSVSDRTMKILRVTQITLSMAFAWNFLYAIIWFFWNLAEESVSDEMMGKMFVFIASATLGVAMIFFIDFLRDRGYGTTTVLQPLINSIGLVIGFSWEMCIWMAITGVSQFLPHHDPNKDFLGKVVLSVTMCLIVLPAWALYILPRVLQFQHDLDGDASDSDAGLSESAEKTAGKDRRDTVTTQVSHVRSINSSRPVSESGGVVGWLRRLSRPAVHATAQR